MLEMISGGGEWIALAERRGSIIDLPLILTDQKDSLSRHTSF